MTRPTTTRPTPATHQPRQARQARQARQDRHFTLPSPVGPLHLTASDDALTGLAFGATTPPPPAATTLARADALGPAGHPIFTTTVAQLEMYFAGTLTRFDLPLAPVGTDFQVAVWSALRAIPYGVAIAYGDLARQLGRPSATRAVGAANGRNPIGIIVPCHRVIGANGSLTGFGGGLDAKRWLLTHESRHTPFALAPGA